VGAIVPYLPDSAQQATYDGVPYYVVGLAYYQARSQSGDTVYELTAVREADDN
jgi:hypothetical protein